MTPTALSRTLDGLKLMLGHQPPRPVPEDMTAEAIAMHAQKRTPEERKKRKALIAYEHKLHLVSRKWRYIRWASILAFNGLFIASYWLDLQLVEGALTASRVLGFHMADLNSSLQLMLAHGHVVINLLIGVVTVLMLYMVFGGRAFCSWVCPYHLVSELAEFLHLRLAEKKIVRDHDMDRRLRAVLFVVFAALAFASGYTLFEAISPVGIMSRALTYGTAISLIWVLLLLTIEVFYSRRFWCRYVCPVGLAYGFAGVLSPVRIVHNAERCLHEGECRDVCLVPHVLDMTKMGYGREVVTPIGADCTRCAMCIDACPTGALTFEFKGIASSKPRELPPRSEEKAA